MLRVRAAMPMLALLVPLASAAAQAPVPDACVLLTTEEVSGALGVKADAGQAAMGGKRCVFGTGGHTGFTARMVAVTVTSAGFFAAGKQSVGPSSSVPVSGVGDEAYFHALGNRAVIEVRKGSKSFEVRMNPGEKGAETIDQIEAIEKSLALKAVPRL
jgi:hypothetical protein